MEPPRPDLEAPHAELEPLRADHASAVLAFETENRAYFARFISDRGDDYFAHFAEQHAERIAEQDAGQAAYFVLVEADGSVVGRVNLIFDGDGSAHLGYRMAERVAGRGVATSAVRRLCDDVAARGLLDTIVAATSEQNLASQRVLTKAGFSLVGAADPAEVGGKAGFRYERELTV
ncbi:MAG: GNAT family N-acetyltransferase [Williamsia herbipolensis]|nr:GNAT family N-acetyltransferase [Williamsia herbipolensis]